MNHDGSGTIDQITERSLYRLGVHNAFGFVEGGNVEVFGNFGTYAPGIKMAECIATCRIKKVFPRLKELQMVAPIPNGVKKGDYVIQRNG